MTFCVLVVIQNKGNFTRYTRQVLLIIYSVAKRPRSDSQQKVLLAFCQEDD